MVRLPDIPLQSWLADQQDLFDRQTQGILEADDFDLKTADMVVPPDAGRQAAIEAETQRIKDEQFRIEQERLAEEHRQQQEAQRAYELQQQERQRQDEIAASANSMAQELGIPTPDDVGAEFSAMEGRPSGYTGNNEASAAFDSTGTTTAIDPANVSTLSDSDNYASSLDSQAFGPGDGSTSPTSDEAIRDSTSFESGLSNTVSDLYSRASEKARHMFDAPAQTLSEVGQQFGEAGKAYDEWSQAETDAGRRAPLRPWGDLGTPDAVAEQERIESDPNLGDEEKVAKIRALFEQQNPSVDPNRDKFLQESREAASSAGHAGPTLIGQAIEILAGDPEQKRDLSAGLAKSLGLGDNITPGAAIANLWSGPKQIFTFFQGVDLAASLLEAPEATAGVLGTLQAISYGLEKKPKYTLAAIGGLVSAIGGAADSLYNQRDFVGGQGTDILDLSLEALAAGAAGTGMIVKGKPTAKLLREAMTSLVHQTGIPEAAAKFDRFLGRLYDEAVIKSVDSANMPALAQALSDEDSIARPLSGATAKMPEGLPNWVETPNINAQLDQLHGILESAHRNPDYALKELKTYYGRFEPETLQLIEGLEYKPQDIFNEASHELKNVEDLLKLNANDPERPIRYMVFDPTDGLPIKAFEQESDVIKFLDDASLNGTFLDYEAIKPKNTAPPTAEDMANFGNKMRAAEFQSGFRSTLKPDEGQQLNKYDTLGARTGAITGVTSGAVGGYNDNPDDDFDTKMRKATVGALVGLGTGTVGGAFAGTIAAKAAADAIANRITIGSLSKDILSTHPNSAYRVAAGLLLSIRNKADDEIVDLGPLLTDSRSVAKSKNPILSWVASRLDNPITTAGEIRQVMSQYVDKNPSYERVALGRAARDTILGYFGGPEFKDLASRRTKESAADEASILGRLRSAKTEKKPAIPEQVDPRFPDEIAADHGAATIEATPKNEYADYWKQVDAVANEIGMPSPRVIIKLDPSINAAAYHDSGNMPVVIVNSGILDTMTKEEFRGILIHEFAHASNDDFAASLLTRSKDFLNSLMGRKNSLDAPSNLQMPRDYHPEDWKYANTLTGAGLGATAGAESDEEPTIQNIVGGMALGIFSSKMKSKAPPLLLNNRIRQMFVDPSTPAKLTNKGIFERINEHVALKWTDSYRQLQSFQDDIAREWYKQTGKVIPAEILAAEMKRFDPGSMAKVAIDNGLKPFLRRFRELGIDNESVDLFMYAQHIVDVVEHAGFDPNTQKLIWENRKFARGLTYREAQRLLVNTEAQWKQVNGVQHWQQFLTAVQGVWDYGDEILQLKRDSGLITDTMYQELRAAYPHYIPMNILRHQLDDKAVPVGKSISLNSNTIRSLSAYGSESDIMSPLASIVGQSYEAFAAAQKNKVFNAVVGLWHAANNLSSTYTAVGGRLTSGERRIADYAALIVPETKGMRDLKDTHTRITGFENGVKTAYWVAKELGNLTHYDTPPSNGVLMGLMDAFKAGATSRNPAFLTANALLDLHGYMVREVAREAGPGAMGGVVAGIPLNPMVHGKVLYTWARALGEFVLTPQAWRDMWRNEYSGDMARLMEQGGGNTGYYNKSGRLGEGLLDQATALLRGTRAESQLEGEVRQLQRSAVPIITDTKIDRTGIHQIGTAADLLSFIKDTLFLKPVERIGERIEMVPRVAAMRLSEGRSAKTIAGFKAEEQAALAAIQRGGQRPPGLRSLKNIRSDIADAQLRSTIEGTQAARTTTIDFAKGGTWAKAINKIVPFFNVSVQSVADVQRAYKENPAAYTASVISGVVMPMYMAEAMNNWSEQTRKDYQDVPQFIKDQGMVVMLPEDLGFTAPVDDDGNRRPQFIHIRFRHLAPIGVLTREMLQGTLFPANAPEYKNPTAIKTALNVAFGFSPIQATDSEDLFMSAVPPGINTALQLSGNRDTFRGRNIVSEYADKRATPLSVGMADTLGRGIAGIAEAGGMSGDSTEPLKHPAWWEFLTRDIGTGYAGMWHGASEILYGKRGVENNNQPQDIPVAGGFINRFQKGTIGENAAVARNDLLTPSSRKLLEDAGVSWRPAVSDPEIEGARLTRAEYATYQRLMNKAVDEGIRKAVSMPKFQEPGATEAYKTSLIDYYVGQARDAAKYTMIHDKLPADAIPQRRNERVKAGEILPRSR